MLVPGVTGPKLNVGDVKSPYAPKREALRKRFLCRSGRVLRSTRCMPQSWSVEF